MDWANDFITRSVRSKKMFLLEDYFCPIVIKFQRLNPYHIFMEFIVRFPYRKLSDKGELRENRLSDTMFYIRTYMNLYPYFPYFLTKVKGKVKCTLVQALRLYTGRTAHRGSRGIALLFLDHGTKRD